LHRLDPQAVADALTRGAILVDIRPAAQRAESGEIPGAVIIERNVLAWRLDPRSADRLPFADRFDLEVIVYCQEGYTSSLAAAGSGPGSGDRPDRRLRRLACRRPDHVGFTPSQRNKFPRVNDSADFPEHVKQMRVERQRALAASA
jgi:rhodanese-related sulfurtransferase